MTTSAPPKLSSEQAKKLALAEAKAGQAKAAADKAHKDLVELRARYKLRIPPSEERKDAGKDVRQVEVGGYLIRVSSFMGGETFSLAGYTEAGHKVTAAMREHITPGGQREKWTVKNLKGPTKPGAVEPAG